VAKSFGHLGCINNSIGRATCCVCNTKWL